MIKCTVDGNLKLDTFSLLMTMKQALMTSNWSVCTKKESESAPVLGDSVEKQFPDGWKAKNPESVAVKESKGGFYWQ